MRTKILLTTFVFLALAAGSKAQEKTWTLDDCINYALSKNIQVQQAGLSGDRDQLYIEQARAARLPSLTGAVRQNFVWDKGIDNQTGNYGSMTGSNNTSYSLSSNMTLFNGFRLNNQLKQNELNLQSSNYNTETIRESVELDILNAYLQVLYAQESVSNAQKQIDATKEQLVLAKERLDLSMISQSDYLQIKSELAGEKLTLANANSQLAVARVSLQQLMELPVTDSFAIASPNLDSLLIEDRNPDAGTIYAQALDIKPQIKKAETDKQVAIMQEKIAKAGMIPDLSLSAGVGTNYSSVPGGFDYTTQLKNQVSPSVGITLSVPVFQNKQARTSVGLAQIGVKDAELATTDTKNQLRKAVEQAVVDVTSAQTEYNASLEQYYALEESNKVAEEKFNVGLINSVDYLFERTNLITAESKLLQSKYNLIFSYKILDFYKGVSLTL